MPIHLQLNTQIRHLILSGTLEPEDQLPSVRALARELLVNPNTIARVYRDLLSAGIAYSRKGEGCYVSPGARTAEPADRALELRPQALRLTEEARRLGVSRTATLDLVAAAWAETREVGSDV